VQINCLPFFNNPLPAKTPQAVSDFSDPNQIEAAGMRALPVQQSSLAALSARTGWTEVSENSNSTLFSYRSDGSLSLQAETSLNFSSRSQETQIELTLSADNFKANLFGPEAFKNGPIQFEFKYWNDTQQIETHTTIQQVNPLRSVGDILQDIGTVLNDILKSDSDKNVHLELDQEAIRALFSDPKVKGLMKELTALICMLNSLATHGGPRDSYTIQVSGKGKPYLDVRQSTSIQAESDHFDLKLIIVPPKATQAPTDPQIPAG
jgi:hypothetical protein